jgi:hypothetical protein
VLACGYPVGYPAQTSAFLRVRGQFFYYDTGFDDFYHLGNDLVDALCKLRLMEDDWPKNSRDVAKTSLVDVGSKGWRILIA